MTGGVDMLEAQKASHERETRAFSDIAVLCRTHRQLELVESCLRHDDIPCIVSGRESWLEDGSVRGFLAFFRWLLRPDDAAALETALRLVWQCPEDIIRQAQAACARQSRLDTAALRQAMPESGHAGQWLACAGEMAGPGRKGKAVEAGARLGAGVWRLRCDGQAAAYGRVPLRYARPAGCPCPWAGGGHLPRRRQKAGRQALCA